ncbi:O-antigen ligase family protein [Qipengyuania xiapuensis]|uniref:O-antigen ligase family protein n=1 Tax=Qipengyuania xiapuensis TaxID=2867236 RepID=A0ABX8ZWR4_9SPHN|nr:O-antigen ligase family protein [Qipengyuania xiapuensis]QZD93297.1 O-antigen ligase family protein [Qipengyuania xiapuensis]
MRFGAICLGLVLPFVTVFLFPTYHVMMETPAFETLRVIETPYLIFEIGFILWAGRNGFDLGVAARALPRDIRIAGAILIVGLFASTLFIAKDVTYALTHSMIWLVHIFFALAVLDVLARRKIAGFDGFMTWHVIGLIALALYTAWWFSFPPPVEELPFGEIRWRGAVPGFIDVRHFGSWTGAIAAGLAVRILFGAQDEGLAPARLFYAIAAGLTVWSGTRAAILAVIVVTVIFLIIHRKLPSLGRIALAAVLTLIACAGAYLLVVDDPVFWLIEPREIGETGDLTATRTFMWGRTIELWLQSPWLGLGTGSIFWEYADHMRPTQPHNVILQFLISWGLLGALPALWIIGRGLRAVHERAAGVVGCVPILGFLYALLFQSLLEGMLHYPRFIVSIIVMAALLFHSAGPGQKAAEEH